MPRFALHWMTAALLLGATSALAQRAPDFIPSCPIQHEQEARWSSEITPSYDLSYSDEAARKLGIVKGRADFFSSAPPANPFVTALTAGVDRSGAMFRFQWHPGD